jgi:hypothetical protein
MSACTFSAASCLALVEVQSLVGTCLWHRCIFEEVSREKRIVSDTKPSRMTEGPGSPRKKGQCYIREAADPFELCRLDR